MVSAGVCVRLCLFVEVFYRSLSFFSCFILFLTALTHHFLVPQLLQVPRLSLELVQWLSQSRYLPVFIVFFHFLLNYLSNLLRHYFLLTSSRIQLVHNQLFYLISYASINLNLHRTRQFHWLCFLSFILLNFLRQLPPRCHWVHIFDWFNYVFTHLYLFRRKNCCVSLNTCVCAGWIRFCLWSTTALTVTVSSVRLPLSFTLRLLVGIWAIRHFCTFLCIWTGLRTLFCSFWRGTHLCRQWV